MISDIRYSARTLLRRKGFALVVVMTLALGIGSATAIYAVVDWILFQAPVSPEGVFAIGSTVNDGKFAPWSLQAHYLAYAERKDVFTEFSAGCYRAGNIVVERDPVTTGYEEISVNFLKMMGVVPALGRDFAAGEDVDGRNQVVIVNDGFWRQNLGGSPDALGRKILIDEQECTVIGVLRKGQRLPLYVNQSVFRPLVIRPNATKPWDPWLIVFGHVRPGVTRKQAEEYITGTKVDLPPSMDWYTKNNKPALATILELEKINRPEMYWVLVGAVGFLFAIACLNSTNLMLVHMLGKQLETSIRMALGGGRWGIIRLLLVEASLLCVCGCVLGAVIANWLIPLFRMVASSTGSGVSWDSWHLGPRTYTVLAGLTLVTGLLIALVPALHVLRTNIQGGLKNAGGAVGESPRLARLRALFVVLQATFAVILLVGAGLMIRTFHRLDDVRLGFDPTDRVKMRLNFPSGYPEEPKARIATLDRLRDALGRVPGVSQVAYGTESLLAGYESMTFDVLGADGSLIKIGGAYVSPDYLGASGMALKVGRWFTQSDQGAVLVNESLARSRFGSENPIGQFIRPEGSSSAWHGWQVIGVVADVRESLREAPGKKIYMPASVAPNSVTSFVVRMSGKPNAEATTRLRQAIHRLDPRIVCYSAVPLVDARNDQLYVEHLVLSVLRVLSAIAILLTIVGLFSILAYTVDRRMPEFGIRMALGATPENLVILVLRRGMALTALGIVTGAAGALVLTRYMQSLLFETPPYDLLVMAAVAGLLLFSALAACVLPALRASRPDLTQLLRSS
jgi:putative ABC transport system permease protein